MKRLLSIVVSLLIVACCFAPCAFAGVSTQSSTSSSLSVSSSSHTSNSNSNSTSSRTTKVISVDVSYYGDDGVRDYYYIVEEGVECHFDKKNVTVRPLYDDEDGTETSSVIKCYFLITWNYYSLADDFYFGENIPAEEGSAGSVIVYRTGAGSRLDQVRVYRGKYEDPVEVFSKTVLPYLVIVVLFIIPLSVRYIYNLVVFIKDLLDMRKARKAAEYKEAED